MFTIPASISEKLLSEIIDYLKKGGENLVKDFTAKRAIKKAIERSAERFANEYSNEELAMALAVDTKFYDLASVQKAIREVLEHPFDPAPQIKIENEFAMVLPKKQSNLASHAAQAYLEILREELIGIEKLNDKLKLIYLKRTAEATERTAKGVENLVVNLANPFEKSSTPRPGSAPPLPSLIVGRENDLKAIKKSLKIRAKNPAKTQVQVLTAVRGWPGVGKTTIASVLAHDAEIAERFPNGVLWVSLGTNPNLLSELATWGRTLGNDDLLKAKTVEHASSQLSALLHDKRMLLIIDDVWKTEHAIPFKVGGRGCAVLITTRAFDVAQALAPTPDDIYRLPVLTKEYSFQLLKKLAPEVIKKYPGPCRELIRELEGLPLALQVAGRMLNVEASIGFSVVDLLKELRNGAIILNAKAPADRTDVANETTPSVAVLLQKSTERLDSLTRDCFAYLGVFAPKPATFDLTAMKAVWQVENPKPIARALVARGLLEPIIETERFQMHAMLVAHAKSLLKVN